MKKVFAVIVLAALPVFAVAQKPYDDLRSLPDEAVKVSCPDGKKLQQENALLRIQITGLQNALMQSQAQEAAKSISEAHAKAVSDLEALNPGKKWDEQQGKLVDKVNAGK